MTAEDDHKASLPDVRSDNNDGRNRPGISEKRIRSIQGSIVFLLAMAVYANTLFNGFVFDDVPNILGNLWIKDIKYIPEIFTTHLAGFDRGFATSYYRPLVHVIYMVCYHVFGFNAWGFHLVNILFHAGVSLLVFLSASRLMEEFNPSGLPLSPFPGVAKGGSVVSPPFIAAVLFAVHPVHTEAVAWISGIMDVSFAFFFLLSFYLYMGTEGRFNRGYLLSVGSFFLSALCKEPALALPIILMAYDCLAKKERVFSLAALKKYMPFFVVAGIYFFLRFHALGGFAPVKKFAGLSSYQYVINIFPLFIQYMEKLIVPLNLTALYVFHPVASIFEPAALIPLLLTLIFILSSFLMRRKKVVLLGILSIVIPLLPALYIPGLGERVFAERYLYLPSFGFVILAALLFTWAYAAAPKRAVILTGALLVLTGLGSAETISRNTVWKDSYSLWSDTAKKSPENAVAHQYLGYALYEKGRLEEAIEHYQIATRLKPNLEDAHINLGVAYAAQGRMDEAIAQYLAALQIRPNSAETHNNLGLAYSAKGWTDKAIEQYRVALASNADFADAYNNLGVAYGNEGRIDKAIENFAAAARLNPDNPNYSHNLSRAYEIEAGSHKSESQGTR